jgi:hypothetical protein
MRMALEKVLHRKFSLNLRGTGSNRLPAFETILGFGKCLTFAFLVTRNFCFLLIRSCEVQATDSASFWIADGLQEPRFMFWDDSVEKR